MSWAPDSGRMRKAPSRASEANTLTAASAREPEAGIVGPLQDSRVGPSQCHRRQVAIQIRNTVGNGLLVGMSDDFR
jgi:hypothetical protein